MSRAVTAIDRSAAIVNGLLLTGVGVIAILWWSGRLPGIAQTTDLAGLEEVPDASWWPWALGAGGIVLALLGLRWLFGHLPTRGVSHLNLTGTDSSGKLLVEAKPVVNAAADELAETEGVRSAKGSVQRDRGQLVATIQATIERDANLQTVAAAADQASGHLRQALERDDLTCRVILHAAGRRRDLPRVH